MKILSKSFKVPIPGKRDKNLHLLKRLSRCDSMVYFQDIGTLMCMRYRGTAKYSWNQFVQYARRGGATVTAVPRF